MLIWAIILGAIFFILFLLYNSLISKKNEVENAFAGIDVQLVKRYDLIPNLVASVQQYMLHEKNLLEQITKLRTDALEKSTDSNRKIQLDNQLSGQINRLVVAMENYPDLKAASNIETLMRSLNEIEEQLSAARRAYNAMVTDYNNALEMVPTNIMAKMMLLKPKELFIAPESKRANINIKELFQKP